MTQKYCSTVPELHTDRILRFNVTQVDSCFQLFPASGCRWRVTHVFTFKGLRGRIWPHRRWVSRSGRSAGRCRPLADRPGTTVQIKLDVTLVSILHVMFLPDLSRRHHSAACDGISIMFYSTGSGRFNAPSRNCAVSLNPPRGGFIWQEVSRS